MPLPARLALAAVAGVALGLSFEPLRLVVLLPFAVAGLALLCRNTTLGRGFLLGAICGSVFMLVLLPWLRVIGTPAWVALSLAEGLFYGLLGMGSVAVSRLRAWPVWVASLWVGIEGLRAWVPFGGFPWGRLSFATIDTPVQGLFAYVAAAGVTFVVALFGAVLAWSLLAVRRTPGRAVVGVVLVGALACSGAVFPWGAGPTARTVTVAAVQGDVPGIGLDAFAQRRAVLNNHVNATLDYAADIAAGKRPAPDMVIWPENSSDIDPYADASARASIGAAARAVRAPLLMGAVVGNRADEGWHNRAIVWSAQGAPGTFYDKIHPVPFGEYIPFRSVLAPRIPALDQIPSDMVPGTRTGVLQVGPARLGVLMCFEVAYDGLLRNLVSGGAEMIVVPTNNATYTGTGQIAQQFAMARLRAIETGRTVVVAATNGISGFLDADGSVIERAPVSQQVVLAHRIPLRTAVTPAIRWGNVIEASLGWLGFVAALVGIATDRFRRRRRPHPTESRSTR